ncbi:hypothetical protein HMPREF9436_00929 [Faecalibacterium cf. prausnitzii KLE1255]|uniref:Uncharacterized protein n=1 Tax=Faecalibacterium cf. prausnitzii KLE1255 TaxID=748224 RepID=E2ZGZ2_9FIRM|nr:hypothetical protein HMPREF9436_00929 [Faecalibacterium cf. prausnitzii KLE1255]
MTKTKQPRSLHLALPDRESGQDKNKKSHTKMCGNQRLKNGKRDRP